MPSPKKGSKSPARSPSRSRKAAVPHVIDYEPESPVIRQQARLTPRAGPPAPAALDASEAGRNASAAAGPAGPGAATNRSHGWAAG